MYEMKQHKILWEQVDIVGQETITNKCKIIEASFMAINVNFISHPSKDICCLLYTSRCV